MICKDCKAQKHGLCRGGTWCDCAHKVDTKNTADQIQAAEPAEEQE